MDQTLYLILAAAVLVTISFILITIGSNALSDYDEDSEGFLDQFGKKDSTGDLLNSAAKNQRNLTEVSNRAHTSRKKVISG